VTDEPIEYYRPAKPDMMKLKQFTQAIGMSKMVSNGPVCRELEETVRDFYGVRYALSCSNCTTGLVLALKVAKNTVNATQCVIPSFTWESTRFAVEANGLNVVYGDCDLNTWLLKPVKVDKNTIVMPVTTFGASLNLDNYGENTVVDAAHAMGTPLDISRAIGAVLSMAPSKIITSGEGGMLITDNSAVASAFSEYRDKFSRMSELNAAMGLAHWDGLDAYIRDRRNRWLKYSQVLKVPQKATLTNYSTAAFRIAQGRDTLAEKLKERGIETRVYYKPLREAQGLENTAQLYKEVICLPTWYGCPTERVLDSLRSILSPELSHLKPGGTSLDIR